MTVPHVCARLGREVVIGEAAADVDGDGRIRNAVIERGGIRITVEVDRVLFEQVGTHDHADVGQGQEQFIAFVDCDHRRRNVAVHDADIHRQARVDVTGQQCMLCRPGRGCGSAPG